MGHHSGRGTAAAAMVHSVLADDDSYVNAVLQPKLKFYVGIITMIT